MNVLVSILIMLALVLINGYFSMSEMALVSARKTILEQEVDENGNKKAARAISLIDDSDRFLATIQVFITLVGFGATAVGTATLAEPLANWFASFNVSWLTTISNGLSVVLITLIVSYVTLVLGELLPKRIALSAPEKNSMRVANMISGCEKAAGPVVRFLAASTNGLAKLFHVKTAEDRGEVTEDEIKYLVTEQDTLLDEEKRMIHEIFDMGDTIARDIMVPRVDMMLMEDDSTVIEVIRRMQGTGFSRVPIFHENHDRIVGVAMLKDLISPLAEGNEDASITDFMREPVFVPETKDILPLLGEMQTSHQQLVIVVDEYGGTAGLITVEDIVEEIVGDIADEFDPDNKFLTRLSDNEWLVDGRFPIDDALEQGWPVEESEEYTTIAGWLLDTIDLVPQVGESFDIGGYRFKVQSMRRHRIALLRVSKLDEPSREEGEPAKETDG